MEVLRVARAGYCYRRPYQPFIERYKPLCPATWPNWGADAKSATEKLVKHLGFAPEELAMGLTKLFIRHPRTVQNLEKR